jgi:hypothetical protein
LNAVELSEALGIPIAACYRRIRALRDAGMLKEEGRVVSIGGKLVAAYRSSVKSAEVILQDGRLSVNIKANGLSSSEEVVLGEEPTMLHWTTPQENKMIAAKAPIAADSVGVDTPIIINPKTKKMIAAKGIN